MSGDTPDKGGNGNGKGGKGSRSQSNDQIIFGLDAVASSAISATGKKSWSLKKGDETLPLLQDFLSLLRSSLPDDRIQIFQLSVEPIGKFDKFRSNPDAVKSAPSLAVSANLAAKPGTLWFTPFGIIWGESKPCMFWSAGDLSGDEGTEGVRTISATGRICSVILTRKMMAELSSVSEDEEKEAEETAFGQIEGKEQEEIHQWVRKYRHLFGLKEGDSGTGEPLVSSSRSQPSAAGPLTINQMVVDSDDEEDEDFQIASDGDGESNTSDSGPGSDEEDEQEDEDADADSDASEDPEGDDFLSPRHHPLLRPGAMPKMSKTAMDMIVGMVEADLSGDGKVDQEDELDD